MALVMGLGILASLSLMLGFFGRASAFVTLQCCLYLYNLNGADAGAHDRYINNALWLLVLADSTATWSVDCRRKTGSWTSEGCCWESACWTGCSALRGRRPPPRWPHPFVEAARCGGCLDARSDRGRRPAKTTPGLGPRRGATG